MIPDPISSVTARLAETAEGSRELAQTIPVIGLWQPYASLVAIGAKPWETRHFPPPHRLVGKRVAIQATLRKPTRDEVQFDLPRQIEDALGLGWERRVPYGAIVCTAILASGWQVRTSTPSGRHVLMNGSASRWIEDDGFGDYSIGRWCWKLEDVHQLAVPIPLKGRQEVGWLWTPDDEQAIVLRAWSLPPPEPRGDLA